MVMPLLTVSTLGAVVGAVFGFGRATNHPLTRAFFGGWAGFGLGATAGLIVDIAAGTELWVPLLGHITAVLGALSAQFLPLEVTDAISGNG